MQISQIRAILAELFDTATEPGTSDAVIEHDISTKDGMDVMSMDASHDLLYAYIDAELDGEDVSVKFPQIYKELQNCSTLKEEYHMLRDLLVAERDEQLEQPPFPALFDFSYLPQNNSIEPSQPWHWMELGKLVVQFSNELLESLQPPASLAAVKSGGEEGGEALFQYTLQGQVEDVDVEIVARTSRSDPNLCNISVFIDIPSRNGWPNLSGSRVLMRRSDESVETQVTDAFGKVLFTDVHESELPSLTFEIVPVDSAA